MHKNIAFANESGENMNENGMLSQLGMLYEYIMNGLYRFSSWENWNCRVLCYCILMYLWD